MLVHEDLIAEEKVEFVTNCEVDWVHIKMESKKDLLVSSFYMSHRNISDVRELRKSLELDSLNQNRQMVVNFSDIDWKNLAVMKIAQDKEVQLAHIDLSDLSDLSADFNFTQVHDKTTRENTLVCLILT